jgi:hypothetical protein
MVLIKVNNNSGSNSGMGFPVPADDLTTSLQLLEPDKRPHGLALTLKDISTASLAAKRPRGRPQKAKSPSSALPVVVDAP